MYPSSLAVRAKGKTGHYLHTLSCGDSFVCLLGIVMFCLLWGHYLFGQVPQSRPLSAWAAVLCTAPVRSPYWAYPCFIQRMGDGQLSLRYFLYYLAFLGLMYSEAFFFEHLVCHIPGYKRCHFKYVFIVAPGGYIAIFPSPAWFNIF